MRSLKEARELFNSVKPSLQPSRVATLEDLAKFMQKYADINYRQGTADLYRVSFQHLIAFLGNRPARFISAIDLENFKEYLLNA